MKLFECRSLYLFSHSFLLQTSVTIIIGVGSNVSNGLNWRFTISNSVIHHLVLRFDFCSLEVGHYSFLNSIHFEDDEVHRQY